MLDFFKKVIDLIFYSNFWIALTAAAMCWQTQLILTGSLTWNWMLGLVFFSTLFLYALHRIIGISKLKDFLEIKRYAVISRFRHHIVFYAILAAIGGAICFWKISMIVKLALIIPGIVSLAYVLPFLSGKKRLRDFNHIKIYLIAVVWAWVTVLLPALELGRITNPAIWGMVLERALFVFAITLPFDIRDLKVDSHSEVKTIPAVIGIHKTISLGAGLLVAAFLVSVTLWFSEFYDVNILLGLTLSFLSTFLIIRYSDKTDHDYFFTGLVDGTMVLQFLLVAACFFWLK